MAKESLDILGASPKEADVWESAKALAGSGNRDFVSSVAAIALSGAEPFRRAAAVYALGFVGGKEGMSLLVGILSNAKESELVRQHAAEALGNVGDVEAVDALLAALQDPSSEIRYWAVYALGEIGGERALPELRRLVENDADPKVVAEAREVVGRLG